MAAHNIVIRISKLKIIKILKKPYVIKMSKIKLQYLKDCHGYYCAKDHFKLILISIRNISHQPDYEIWNAEFSTATNLVAR